MKARFPRGRAGFVLIVVLGVLAVMTVLLLALLRGAAHQVRGGESDAALAQEKMLADSAVALVIGQIQAASTQTGVAWISQPGLLRTFTTANSRTPAECYKLYSAADLTDTSGNLGFLAGDVPADWNSTANQNLYTDLNTPVQTSGASSQALYPILDPAAVTAVQGVGIDAPHSVEMPVMWLYQLRDGTLGPASNGTAANPIVGRIAFWTDDETCKINLNTAGGGAAWNTARANSTDDAAWVKTQPAQGEFSRYPGHPATTSLVPVFGQGATPPTAQQLLALTPRYAWGGSQDGTENTTAGETVAAKTDRLYASVDELLFGSTLSPASQRQLNSVTPAQIEQARFVLTAHSEAPETTLLGEPRVAIWPISDQPDVNHRTPADSAIVTAATVGAGQTASAGRAYYFQRGDPMNALDDFDTSSAAGISNVQLFTDLVARGGETIPGYGTTFLQKYPSAEFTQLILEIADFIRGLNAVDPTPSPFVPFSGGISGNRGRGFIVPLTATYGAGTPTAINLRAIGRCPTLSGLTLVFYVSGFTYLNAQGAKTTIDFETNADTDGSVWANNFQPSSSNWQHLVSERIRAFVVPSTFQPGCGYPEVSDSCQIQIQGLDGIGVTSTTSNDFQFQPVAISPRLDTPLQTLTADRAWGGNEGPLVWRICGDMLAGGGTMPYPFAGTQAYDLPMGKPTYNLTTQKLTWPALPTLTFQGLSNLTVQILDPQGNPLQTLQVAMPSVSFPAPTPLQEYTKKDGGALVAPSYYMRLENRLLATHETRPFLIQPGDCTRTIEPHTDLRLVACLASVPATFFAPSSDYSAYQSQVHNLAFADGTSAYGSTGSTSLMGNAAYSTASTSASGLDWTDGSGQTTVTYPLPANSPRSAPRDTIQSVTMKPLAVGGSTALGDWDTGVGLSADGAQVNLPDEGTSLDPTTAYLSLTGGQLGAPTRFAPNALVPSPVIFGSLPAGINPANPAQSEPWRTLLFCPNPAAGFQATPPTSVTAGMHPGFASPPDHLLLDNFWMPAVEPYALSTCMATAGKINLNDQIAPFTYLHRNTAFHALLHDLRIPAIPVAQAGVYKSPPPSSPIASIWLPVDETATIAALESRFATGDAYLSESEICAVPLVPQGQTVNTLANFWNASTAASPVAALTGDNLRELPYAQLYGRLTTRSNSYTVHVRVQVLQKLPHDPQQNVWNEGADLVLGDWRGSYEIERYLDPAAPAPIAGQPLGPYRFRIVSMHRFAP